MATSSDAGYTVTLLPHSHPDPNTWASLVSHHKNLRLRSLQISPESFSSTFEREVAFTDSDWENRLKNPLAYTFIAAKVPTSLKENGERGDELDDAVHGEWVGMTVLVGPLDELPNNLTPNSKADGAPQRKEVPVESEIFAVFVSPEARGLGLGKRLSEASIAQGKVLGREKGAKEVVVRLSVARGNGKAKSLYEKLGFRIAEDEVRVEDEEFDALRMEMRLGL
jgi:ribosomal protein S18 acetylase RimI-like enzyme